MDENFIRKVKFEGIDNATIAPLKEPTFTSLARLAFKYSDGIIMGSKRLPSEIEPVIKEFKIPVLNYQDPADYIDAYSVFYDRILTEAKK
jgi:starch synthase